MKALAVFGTRPEVIKMFPVMRQLTLSGHDVRLLTIRQHESLLDQTLSVFDVSPDYSANVVTKAGLSRLNNVLLTSVEYTDRAISNFDPNVVLVQGDTTTGLGAALSAFNGRVPVAHIEAGLQTGDLNNPYPEEMNRITIDGLSSFHYCPTQRAASHIKRSAHCIVAGNTELDSILWLADRANFTPQGGDYVVITMHRRENQGDPFTNVREAVQDLAESSPKTTFYIVVHPNPEVKKSFVFSPKEYLPNVKLLNPLPYEKFIPFISNAHFVITDSGGVQEACSFLNVPVLVARNKTERMEGVVVGGARLVGLDREVIGNAGADLLCSDEMRKKMASAPCPYGNGFASKKIAVDLGAALDN